MEPNKQEIKLSQIVFDEGLLAAALGVSESTVSDWLSRTRKEEKEQKKDCQTWITMTMDDVVSWIVAEAERRLTEDHACPGGINSKIHGVSMEIDLKLCEIMKEKTKCR
jgi:predicted transcriptional regulator